MTLTDELLSGADLCWNERDFRFLLMNHCQRRSETFVPSSSTAALIICSMHNLRKEVIPISASVSATKWYHWSNPWYMYFNFVKRDCVIYQSLIFAAACGVRLLMHIRFDVIFTSVSCGVTCVRVTRNTAWWALIQGSLTSSYTGLQAGSRYNDVRCMQRKYFYRWAGVTSFRLGWMIAGFKATLKVIVTSRGNCWRQL